MLDPEILRVANERAILDLDDRRSLFAREVLQIRERMNARGALHSSGTQRQLLDAIANELRVRSSLIWHAFARALQAKAHRLDPDTVDEVKVQLEALLDRLSADLTESHHETQQLIEVSPPLPPLSDLRSEALARIFSEVDFAALSDSQAARVTSGGVTIYQSYGIVQTGSHSSGSLTISIGTEERQAIEAGLAAVERAVEAAVTLSDVARAEAIELVADIRAELQRARPNGLRIRGAVQGLATTIRTVASAPTAYGVLKGAAALIGLHLP